MCPPEEVSERGPQVRCQQQRSLPGWEVGATKRTLLWRLSAAESREGLGIEQAHSDGGNHCVLP